MNGNKYELYLSFDGISNIEAEKVIENYMHSFGYIQFAVDSTTLVIKEKESYTICDGLKIFVENVEDDHNLKQVVEMLKIAFSIKEVYVRKTVVKSREEW